MDDSLRDKLRGLIQTRGRDSLRDADGYRNLVREACQNKRTETKVLLEALEEQVPSRLLEAPGVDAALLDRLRQGLEENQAMAEEAARWAVGTWVIALGLADGIPPPAPTPSPAISAETAGAQAVAQGGGSSAPVPPVPAAAAFDIEPPACFYLGREYDLDQRKVIPDKFLMYDARDLTTHGVIVGMTGSGKTGLAISLLEEAAIDGYPCIIIDPKGDLANLLLQFPSLDPDEIKKWLDPEEARSKGMTLDESAAELAKQWRKGLAETYQTPERIQRLKQACSLRIYTPGSEAGLPLSVLSSFSAPPGRLPQELLTHKAETTATALLGLTDVTADPIQSREHILISKLLLHAWEKKQTVNLEKMILDIQNPPMRTVGAYSMETFFPAKDRIKFASMLNNVIASPSFSIWSNGEPLDLDVLLYRNNRPQQLIFHVSHLDDHQRMFFITLLLEEVLNWTRRQPGSSNLRALLYFDEVTGYIPPHPANPPSKGPLLTLFKQARAFGVGVLLATQNPVDLDYKSLSNAGTWFVGKLQTERDKSRLMDGLQTVAAEQGTLADRKYLEKVIPSLGNRVFLMHNVHRKNTLLFQSRFTLSLLRGPMTRDEVSRLMKDLKQPKGAEAIPLCMHCHSELEPNTDRCPNCGKRPWANPTFRQQEQAERERLARSSAGPPVLPAEVTQFYLSPQGLPRGDLEYQAQLVGIAEVVFVIDKRKGTEHVQPFRLLAMPPEVGHPVDWEHAAPAPKTLASGPAPGARWAGVPAVMDTGRKLKSLAKAFADYLYSTQKLPLFQNRHLELMSEPGESEAAFKDRCRLAAVREAEQALQMEKVKFGPKFQAIGMKLPEEQPQKQGSIWSWLFGSATPAPRAPTGAPATRQEEKERKLAAEYQAKKNEICEKWKRIGEEALPVEIKPRKTDVRITHFGIAWAPR